MRYHFMCFLLFLIFCPTIVREWLVKEKDKWKNKEMEKKESKIFLSCLLIRLQKKDYFLSFCASSSTTQEYVLCFPTNVRMKDIFLHVFTRNILFACGWLSVMMSVRMNEKTFIVNERKHGKPSNIYKRVIWIRYKVMQIPSP